MSVVELAELEEVKGLLAKGQRVGVLTYAEIATATAGLDVDEADVEELHGFFERSEIELAGHAKRGFLAFDPNERLVRWPARSRNSGSAG